MTSTFFGLDLALWAVHAQRAALDVTNHNVANAATRGFTRKHVNIVATNPSSEPAPNRPGDPGQSGTGAIAQSIRRARHIFTHLQFRTEIGSGAQAQVAQDAPAEIRVILDEPSGTGVSNLLQELFRSWQDPANNPAAGANRAAVVQQSTALAEAFNPASVRLTRTSG